MFELSKEEESKLEKNLVWIFADRRSGTTWLGKELLSHETKYIDEPLIGSHLALMTGNKKSDARTISIQAERDNYFFSKQHKDVWLFFLRKLILNRIYNESKTFSQKIIIKEPTGSFGADIISQCLPNSKIIIIFRDGRDIVDSKLDSQLEGSWATKRKRGTPRSALSESRRSNFITNQSLHWVNLMQILKKTYENHSENLCFRIKYEDLRKNTEAILPKIYKFLELEISEKEIQKLVEKYAFENIPDKNKGKLKFKRFATPGLWKKNFSQEETEIMNNLMKNTLEELEYQVFH